MPGHRVAGRPARGLDRRPHDPVERLGAFGVDQGHRPLDQRLLLEECLVGMGDHVDNGVADADDVDGGFTHARGHGLWRGQATEYNRVSIPGKRRGPVLGSAGVLGGVATGNRLRSFGSHAFSSACQNADAGDRSLSF